MQARRKIALVLYVLVALSSLVLGLTYFLRESFLPYHEVALGVPWLQLDEPTRILLLALMDVAGGGWLALFVFVMALVLIPFRRGEVWARYTIPVGILALYVPTLLATLGVLYGTPATPPWYGAAVACATAVVGFLLDAPWTKSSE
jgi:hypothetical protein